MRDLLTRQRVMALGVVVDGEPVVGLLPYAITEDFAALVVQASRLARHTQGLNAGGRWSGLIHEPLADDGDALQVPRLTLDGEVAPVQAGDADYDTISRVLVARVPGAARTLGLGDFGLYRLQVSGGRMVLGFGRALNLSRSHFVDLATP